MDVPEVPSKVDPDALTAVLDGRWAELRRGVRAQMAGAEFRDPVDLGIEAHRAQVLDQLRALAATDRPGLGFDPAYGGGGDVGGSVTSFELLGYGDLSLMVKAGVQWGLFGGAVQLLGTERHHERYLRGIIDLDVLGCFAMTEHGHGSDVQHLRTTATYTDGGFVIDTPDAMARKEYIGNAARDGRLAVVFAQLITGGESRGVHAFLVPIRDEDGKPVQGVSIEDCGPKAGLNGVDNGRLGFDHVRVPREALLNRFGDVAEDGTYSSPIESDSRRFFTMLGTLIRGRVSVGGSAGSATKRALALAIRYGEHRHQFMKPDGDEVVILDYLGHQRKLLPALAKTYALNFAQEELVSKLHDIDTSAPEEEQRELESRAAGLKALNTWHATATIQAAREACGGAGYLAENILPGLKADTDVFTTFEGDNTVLLQLVAKGLLTSYKQDFEDLSPLATARFFTDQVVNTILERTSVRKALESLTEGSDSDVFFRREWQLRLFEDREEHVVEGVAKRLRKAAADPFGVFNAAQDHVLRAGRVHVERLVLEAFVAGIERCEDPEARALLERVCDLYALSAIEEDLAWFLGHGRLTASRAKAVTSAVNRLCAELRPHARTLVDAFAIPEQFLAAPMLTS
ncbi:MULTISPECIES: acyl-CoA dehydrogenase [unclassified Amycolatopsis]|uniref:acyl-CoA dehydrogenase family protein n=1 Tax=unclassified Amycolatopsis TaxID=2618356 RepID=UPI00287495F1|nr:MULTISPECIES: acyl-CoA dehydrogenase [unclassified Amycolatopsis]MDS0137453.1 acyl-CoA dehydrogenase family protein [Amycolatopsis sp. 505]MDS0141648.1 acyl-CoA dehydrogenase family protein [Amycolatopsis sp. CM201R]